MSLLSTALEFIAPGRMHRDAIPPLEAGLRPNTELDAAPVLATFEDRSPDDVAPWDSGHLVSHGAHVTRVTAGGTTMIATLPGKVTALAATTGGVLAAVDGHGISHVAYDGTVTSRWTDDRVRHHVTALAATGDDSAYVCIGSTSQAAWEQALVRKADDGQLIEVAGDTVRVVDEGLAWPSGVLPGGDGLLLSLSQAHRVELRPGSGARSGAKTVLKNLPGYPGRLARSGGQVAMVMPYMRNRAVELVLRDEDLRTDMLELDPDSWLIPRLGVTFEHRIPLQVGQIRVLGEIKPWAPPRTYGLALAFTDKGLVTESVHSRADGSVHGITGITATGRQIALVSNGSGRVVSWKRN